MALSANTVWEVRNGGSDTNGGGFVTGSGGTDYSQQTAAQLTVTDAACSGTTTVTSATGGFTAAMVGNGVYLSSGPGWYQITGYTNTNTVTIDRAGPSASGMTLRVGGAFASPGMAGSLTVSGNITYIKYSATPYDISTSSAGSGGPCRFSGGDSYAAFIGYDTTRSFFNTDANRPTLRATAGSLSMVGGSGDYQSSHCRNLICDANGQTSVNGFDVGMRGQANAYNCTAIGCANGFNQGKFYRCFAHGCTTGFSSGSFDDAMAYGCFAYGGTTGFNGSIGCVRSVAWGCGSQGFYVGRPTQLCVAYGNTGTGFVPNWYAYFGISWIDCVSYSNGAYGFDLNGRPAAVLMVSCAAGSNTSGLATNVTDANWQSQNPLSLTANPFDSSAISALTSASAIDALIAAFTPNATAGGGAVLRAAGLVAYGDVGAVQHQDAGGTTVYSPSRIIQSPGWAYLEG